MCMMQSPIKTYNPKVHAYKKHEKKEITPFDEALLKPDPTFVDERKKQKVEDKGFFSKLLGI